MTLEEFNEAFPPWFWYLGAALAVGCGVLFVLYYLEHDGRSPFEDFAAYRQNGVFPGRVPPSADVAAAEAAEAEQKDG